jgi:hypothetical protein
VFNQPGSGFHNCCACSISMTSTVGGPVYDGHGQSAIGGLPR